MSSGGMISQTGWSSVPDTDMWVIGAVPHEVPGTLWMRELLMCLFFSCCQTSFSSLMKRRGPLSCPSQVRPQTLWTHISLSYEVFCAQS